MELRSNLLFYSMFMVKTSIFCTIICSLLITLFDNVVHPQYLENQEPLNFDTQDDHHFLDNKTVSLKSSKEDHSCPIIKFFLHSKIPINRV